MIQEGATAREGRHSAKHQRKRADRLGKTRRQLSSRILSVQHLSPVGHRLETKVKMINNNNQYHDQYINGIRDSPGVAKQRHFRDCYMTALKVVKWYNLRYARICTVDL